MDTSCASRLLHFKVLAKSVIFFISVFGIDRSAIGQDAPRPDAGEALTSGTHGLPLSESENGSKAAAAAKHRAQIGEFQNAKMIMLQEMEQAMANASKDGSKERREAVEQWREQNGARLRAVQEQAIALADSQPDVKAAPFEQARLPESASEELKALLNGRMLVYNGEIETLEQMAKHPEQADAIARKENGKRERDTALVRDLAQAVARQSERQPFLIPPQPGIPPDLAPEIRSLLIERNALLNERANALKQNPPQAGQTQGDWLMNWHKSQPDRLQKLGKKASEAAEK